MAQLLDVSVDHEPDTLLNSFYDFLNIMDDVLIVGRRLLFEALQE